MVAIRSKKRVISFDNSSIQNIVLKTEDFGKSQHLLFSFSFSKDEGSEILKGLHLVVMKNTLSKYFILRGTFNKKRFKVNLGKFAPKFKCREVRSLMVDLSEKIRNSKLEWLIDPKIYLEENRPKKEADIVKEYSTPTIKQAIEEICKSDFPRLRVEGSLARIHLTDMFRYLCGYNVRARYVKFSEYQGDGVMTFRDKPIATRIPGPNRQKPIKDWNTLFKLYPGGVGVFPKGKHYNVTGVTSLYDDPISDRPVTDLDKGFMKSYVLKYKVFGTQKNCLKALKYLWAFCSEKDYFGSNPGFNPGQTVIIKRPKNIVNFGSRYNKHKFSIGELERIRQACIDLKDEYPFRVQVILFMMFTGRRFQEVIKIKRSYVKEDQGIIQIPKEISKIREDQFVTITKPVKFVLDMLEDQRNTEGYQITQRVPWLFPTPRVITSTNLSEEYLNSFDTRMKVVFNAWLSVKEKADITFGALKSFRKTYSTIATQVFNGDTQKASKLTGHLRPETLERFYYQEHQQEVVKSATQVAEILEFKKAN
jgi:integrase